MNLKKNTIYKTVIVILFKTVLFAEGVWVNYGWELFEYVIDARTASLGSATTAYNFDYIQSSIINPSFVSKPIKDIALTHQSRYAGLINSELVGIQLMQGSKKINLNIIYQGISDIPDTRMMLLDWGEDGQFGTNDLGEGNGVLDQGERLDKEKLRYFNQHQFGLHSAFHSKIFDFPIGIGYKVLSYILDNHFALGVGIDIGYNTIVNQSSIGFVIRNFPASGLIWDSGLVEGTTPSFSLGLFHPLNYFTASHIQINTMTKLDGSFSNITLDSHFKSNRFALNMAFGVECIYKNKLMIRFGRNSVNNYTGGIGVKIVGIDLDYAFLFPTSNSMIGNHHLISLNLSLNWISSIILNG